MTIGIWPEKLQLARCRLIYDENRSFVASALMSMTAVPRPGLGTLGVDAYWRLYYDPKTIDEWKVDNLAWVLYHQVWHLLDLHHERAAAISAHPVLWNMSADAAINRRLVYVEGAKLPGAFILPSSLGFSDDDELFVEEYYERLQSNGKKNTLSSDHGEGDSSIEEDAHGMTAEANQKPSPLNGRCGSCATGVPEAWEDGPPNTPGAAPGITPIEAEVIRRIVATEIKQRDKARGDIPDDLLRWADKVLSPRVNWRRVLGSAIRYAMAEIAGMSDYSYRRPSRRASVIKNIILPGFIQYFPRIAVVVDTSRSMDGSLLSRAVAEVDGILRVAAHRDFVNVLSCDAAVHTCQKVFKSSQIRLSGGGGTDMRIGIDAALSLKPRPDVVIVITDGYTPWPEKPPSKVKVIVCLIGDGSAPSWAKVCKVTQDEP